MAHVFDGGVEINELSRGTGIDHRVHVRCATTSNITISTGLNPGDVIDGVTLVAGDRVLVKDQSMDYEETQVTTVADVAGSLGGTYFLLNSPTQGYYIWFDVDNGSTDPGASAPDLVGSGRIGVEIDISAGDTANTVAANLTSDINTALSPAVLTATNTGAPSAVVDIVLADPGNVQNSVDGASPGTGFSFAITNGGSSDVEHGIYVCAAESVPLGLPTRAEDMVTGDGASHVFVHVEEGTANGNTAWVCKNVDGSDVVDTDALLWVQYALYDYLKGDIVVAGSDRQLEKITRPTNTSLLQIDGNGDVTWVNKNDILTGFDPKESVRFATNPGPMGLPSGALTGTGLAYTAGGGSSGTGEFTNVDLTAAGALDLNGNTIALNDRILVKNQADATQNGIYVVTSLGTDSTDATIERAPDQDGANPPSNLSSGNFTFVELGSTVAQTGWVTQGDGILEVNTDDIDWVQFNGAASLIEGPGIDITGNKISIDGDGVTIGSTLAGAASTDDAAVASVISNGTAGNVLISTGTAGDSATYGAITLSNTNSVTGVLDETNGGTGQSSYTTGDILFASAANTLDVLAIDDYSTLVAGATVPTWSTSVYADSIIAPDATGQTFVDFVDTASAVNNLTITNNATTAAPSLAATGTDTNIDLDLISKGTGCVSVKSTGANPGCINFFDDDDSNAITLASPAAVTTDRTWLLPVEDPSASDGYVLQTDSSGQWSFVNPNAASPITIMLTSVRIRVNNNSFNDVAYFAWDDSVYGDYANGTLVMFTDRLTVGTPGNRDIDLEIIATDTTGATVTVLASTAITAEGIVRTNIQAGLDLLAGTDYYIAFRVQRSAAGGQAPFIYGMHLEFNH